MFFVELAGHDIGSMEHVLEAMNTATLRGKAKTSNKNPNVAQTLTASDVNTAKLSKDKLTAPKGPIASKAGEERVLVVRNMPEA